MIPDLSHLSVEEASFLEQAMAKAEIAFKHETDSYRRSALAGEPGSSWADMNWSLAREARTHQTDAAFWRKAADAHCRQANRDRCIAIRVIQAFAQVALAVAGRLPLRVTALSSAAPIEPRAASRRFALQSTGARRTA